MPHTVIDFSIVNLPEDNNLSENIQTTPNTLALEYLKVNKTTTLWMVYKLFLFY